MARGSDEKVPQSSLRYLSSVQRLWRAEIFGHDGSPVRYDSDPNTLMKNMAVVQGSQGCEILSFASA